MSYGHTEAAQERERKGGYHYTEQSSFFFMLNIQLLGGLITTDLVALLPPESKVKPLSNTSLGSAKNFVIKV